MTTESITADSVSKSSGSLDGRVVAVVPTPSQIDLKTIDDIRVEMARVYRDMRVGRVDPAVGTRLAYVLSRSANSSRWSRLKKRLEVIEGVEPRRLGK